MHRLRQWLWLLLILCAASLASLPLVAVTLPPPPARVTTTPKPSSPQACTGSAKIEYARSQPTVLSTPALWDKAGQNKQAFFIAQACAALFTTGYEAFDADHPAALTAVATILSPAARQSFFKGIPPSGPDYRLNPTWQVQARKKHLKQTVRVNVPATLKRINTQAGTLSVQFAVQYTMTTTEAGKKTTQNKQLMVELTPQPGIAAKAATAWQITAWTDTSTTTHTGGGKH